MLDGLVGESNVEEFQCAPGMWEQCLYQMRQACEAEYICGGERRPFVASTRAHSTAAEGKSTGARTIVYNRIT